MAAAEQLYLALHTWKKAGSLSITDTSLSFFSQIYRPAMIGTFDDDSATYAGIMRAVRTYADGLFVLHLVWS